MYKLSTPAPRFFFRHLFCGGRGGKYYGRIYQNIDLNNGSYSNANTSNATPMEFDRNKPFYFDLSMDRNLKKIDHFNECFKHFYEKHDGSKYINKFENIFDQWNNEFAKYRGFRTPKTDIIENEKGIKIRIEVPSISKENVKIEYINNVLNIHASNKKVNNTNSSDQNSTIEQEEHYEFKKSIILPEGIDTSSIKASVENGVLKIFVPKESYINSKSIVVE